MFPNGEHDDQVDGAARAFNQLIREVDARPAGTQVSGL